MARQHSSRPKRGKKRKIDELNIVATSSSPLPSSSKSKYSAEKNTTPQWTVNGRSFIGHFRHFFTQPAKRSRGQLVSITLRPCHLEIIKQTPFGHFINIPDIPISRGFLSSIFECWDHDLIFVINGVSISFTTVDVALLLGLPDYGAPIDLKREPSGYMYDKYFSKFPCTRNRLEDLMLSMHSNDNNLVVLDFCRVYILYIFACVLFSCSNYTIPKSLLALVDNLTMIHNFNWARAIHSFMAESIPIVGDRIRRITTSHDIVAVGYLTGCLPLLMGWFCEHVSIFKPSKEIECPRLWKWMISALHWKTVNKMFDKLSTEDIIPELCPLPSETWLMPKVVPQIEEPSWEKTSSTTMPCQSCQEYCDQTEKLVKVEDHDLQHVKATLGRDYSNFSLKPVVLKVSKEVPQTIHKDALRTAMKCSPYMLRRREKITKYITKVYKTKKEVKEMEKEKEEEKAEEEKKEEEENKGEEQKEEEEHEEKKGENEKKKQEEEDKEMVILIHNEMDAKWREMEEKKIASYEEERKEIIKLYESETAADEKVARIIQDLKNLSLKTSTFWATERLECSLHSFLILLNTKVYTNEEALDAYSSILARKVRSSRQPYHRSIFMYSGFQERYHVLGPSSFKMCCKTDEDSDVDFIFVPLHSTSHWHLLVVDMRKKLYLHYNSLNSNKDFKQTFNKVVWMFKKMSVEDLMKLHLSISPIIKGRGWKLKEIDCPKQYSSLDCAIFVMEYMDHLMWGKPMKFTQNDMKFFRLEIAYEIMHDEFCHQFRP